MGFEAGRCMMLAAAATTDPVAHIFFKLAVIHSAVFSDDKL